MNSYVVWDCSWEAFMVICNYEDRLCRPFLLLDRVVSCERCRYTDFFPTLTRLLVFWPTHTPVPTRARLNLYSRTRCRVIWFNIYIYLYILYRRPGTYLKIQASWPLRFYTGALSCFRARNQDSGSVWNYSPSYCPTYLSPLGWWITPT